MKSEWFYPCAYSCWGAEEHAAIARVLKSGQFTMAGEVEAFESEFSAWHGMKHAVMVNSGSSANLVAVAALFHKRDNPLKRSDKAIVPALAWATTYAPLVQYGLDLVLADCDDTWGAAGNLSPDAKLILTCPVLGNPCRPVNTTNYHIEDNCESIGAWLGPLGDKRYCGTFGLMDTFSFYHSHQLSAIEGGMILTDDDEMNGLCRMLRDHGMTRWKGRPHRFEHEYDFRVMGFNVRPLEMHAAIAREQLKRLEEFARLRQQNLNNFNTVVMAKNLPIQPQQRLRNAVPNPFGIAFTCESNEGRSRLVAALRAQGIDCRLPTGGSFRMHPYAAQWANQETPNADRIHETGLFLGNGPLDLSPQIERALKIIKETL